MTLGPFPEPRSPAWNLLLGLGNPATTAALVNSHGPYADVPAELYNLCRNGYVTCHGDVWAMTEAGRAEWQRRYAERAAEKARAVAGGVA